MSLSSILSIARSALLTHQRAMAVTAHNVANAQTPGYTKQTLSLVAETPLFTPDGQIGRGVTDNGVTRARNQFFDSAYRRESGLLGNSSTMRDLLGEVEAAINEPSDTGISSALDGLFQSFGDLANDPASRTNRDMVRSSAERFAQRLHTLDTQITQVTTETADRLRSDVGSANQLASQIAALNVEILSTRGGEQSAPDVEDQRDLLVDQLSSLMDVRVLPQSDGTISVVAGDTMLVEAGTAHTVELKPIPAGGFGVGIQGNNALIQLQGGSIKALSDLTSNELPSLRGRLDTFTQTIVEEVNRIHRAGYTPAGATGVDFFDPAGVTARTIRLSDAVAASGDAIAASGTGASGDNAVALQLAQLAHSGVATIGGKTLRDFYTDIASSVGVGVSDATNDAWVHQSLVDHADSMRSSTSGVSIDEEMVNLIAQQEAYSAASRMVQTANEMVQTILNMMG